MKRSAQKINATTQRFTEIEDIIDDIVIMVGGQACLILEVIATNFTLQSKEEQESKIIAYASLLNSLSFTIQIIILNRKLDISSYVKLLEIEANKSQNQMLSKHIMQYKDFVSELVKTNIVLEKNFYIVIPFSFLEKGAAAVANMNDKNAFVKDAKVQLHSKSSSLIQELLRIGLKSKILMKNELIQVFYEIYNSDSGKGDIEQSINNAMVKGVRSK